MTQKHHLHYVLVADSSSSMDCQIDEVRDEINIQIAKLRDESDPELRPCTFTFRTFNSKMKNVHVNLPIHKVPKIKKKHYEAEGLTALYDAIGSSIVTMDKMVGHRLDGINESLVIIIFSDGGENASKEFDAKKISALLKEHQEKPGFNIAFVGCDPASFQDMRSVEFAADRMWHYEKGAERQALYSVHKNVSNIRFNLQTKFSTEQSKD